MFNNSFTKQSNLLNSQKQYDQWEKKLDTMLYNCLKKYQHIKEQTAFINKNKVIM